MKRTSEILELLEQYEDVVKKAKEKNLISTKNFVRDITGKIVLKGEISSGNQVITTGQLSNGLYFIELRRGDSLIGVQRIMKTQ
jgi:hypothetical protein